MIVKNLKKFDYAYLEGLNVFAKFHRLTKNHAVLINVYVFNLGQNRPESFFFFFIKKLFQCQLNTFHH